VNVANVSQAAGFLSRVRTGNMDANHTLGYLMIALALPAIAAAVAFVRTEAGWFHWIGPAVPRCGTTSSFHTSCCSSVRSF
jgi:hypothetical protein